jgi:sensor histidine kinase regulating citrate/malate metabolism
MYTETKERFSQIVTVKGLVNAKAHNGKQGQIEDYAEERGRFMVELDEVRRRKLVATFLISKHKNTADCIKTRSGQARLGMDR